MSTILCIDPGMRTGLVDALVEDDKPPTILWKEQADGGLWTLIEWDLYDFIQKSGRTVCEKFHPRQMARSYKMEELEPLRIEGYVLGNDPGTVFRQPEQRKLIKGEGIPASAEFLKWAGYWTVASDLDGDFEDANDVNSAMMHLFGYLRDNKHRPTISLLLDYNRSIGMKEGTE